MSMKYKSEFMDWIYIMNIFIWGSSTYSRFLKEKGLEDNNYFKHNTEEI